MVAIHKELSTHTAEAVTKGLKLHKRPIEKTQGREERRPRQGRTLRGVDLHTRPKLAFTKEMLMQRMSEVATRHDLESSVTSSLPVRHPGNIFIILGEAQRASMQGNEQVQLANVQAIHANSLQMANVNASLNGLAENMKKISAEMTKTSKDGHDSNIWKGIGDWFTHFGKAAKAGLDVVGAAFEDHPGTYGPESGPGAPTSKKGDSNLDTAVKNATKASESFQKFQKNNKTISTALGILVTMVAVAVVYGACVLATGGAALAAAGGVGEIEADLAVTAEGVGAGVEGAGAGAGDGAVAGAEGAESAEGAAAGADDATAGADDAASTEGDESESVSDSDEQPTLDDAASPESQGSPAEEEGGAPSNASSEDDSAANSEAKAGEKLSSTEAKGWLENAKSYLSGNGSPWTFAGNWLKLSLGTAVVGGLIAAAVTKEKLSFSTNSDATAGLSAEVQADSTESMVMSQVAQSFQQDDSVAMSNLNTLNNDNQAAASFAASSAQNAKQVDTIGNMF